MHQQSPSATAARRWRSRAKLAAGTLALTMGAVGAGLIATTLPAYADVLSTNYTIGTPSGRWAPYGFAGLGRGVSVGKLPSSVSTQSVHSLVQATPR